MDRVFTNVVIGLTLFAAAGGLASCGPPGPEKATISVTDSPDALTSGGNDNLFTLTLTQAPKSYALSDISVSAGLPGQTETAVNFTHNDSNGNGLLDQGETLNCKEPPVNLFDASTVGKAVTVHFAVKEQGTYFQLASATWTPAN